MTSHSKGKRKKIACKDAFLPECPLALSTGTNYFLFHYHLFIEDVLMSCAQFVKDCNTGSANNLALSL
jgi:hypothetical protein